MGPLLTLLLAGIGLGISVFSPIVYRQIQGRGAEAAQLGFGPVFTSDVVAFQGIVLGVLVALFIARVIAPTPQASEQTAVDVAVALFGHALAAIVLDAALLTILSAESGEVNGGHPWFVVMLSLVAGTLAQWVHAGVTLGRKKQRRRAKNDLLVASWTIHRRAAALLPYDDARTRPLRRLWTTLIAVWFVSAVVAAVASATAAAASTHSWAPFGPLTVLPLVLIAGIVSLWSTLWATIVVSCLPENGDPWYPVVLSWLATAGTVGVPTAVLLIVPITSGEYLISGRTLIVFAAVLPFVTGLSRAGGRDSLRVALLKVELRRQRRRRASLLRDFYALRKNGKRQNAFADDALLAALRGGVAATDWLPKVASLATNRPPSGLGSTNWWIEAGRPPLFHHRLRNEVRTPGRQDTRQT